MLKLYNFYKSADGNGYVGIIITILLYGGILIMNLFIFYNYLVFLHMEGRLIDIFTRVTGDVNSFFVPLDNEVSARYLRWVIHKTQKENEKLNGESHGTKHPAVTYHTVENLREGFCERTTYICIYRKRDDGNLVLYRHFVRTNEGAICELEESLPFTVDDYPLLEQWPTRRRRLLGSEESRIYRKESMEKEMKENYDQPSGAAEPVMRSFREDNSFDRSEASFLEPQVVLIKGD